MSLHGYISICVVASVIPPQQAGHSYAAMSVTTQQRLVVFGMWMSCLGSDVFLVLDQMVIMGR